MLLHSLNEGALSDSMRDAVVVVILKPGKPPDLWLCIGLFFLLNADAKLLAKIPVTHLNFLTSCFSASGSISLTHSLSIGHIRDLGVLGCIILGCTISKRHQCRSLRRKIILVCRWHPFIPQWYDLLLAEDFSYYRSFGSFSEICINWDKSLLFSPFTPCTLGLLSIHSLIGWMSLNT